MILLKRFEAGHAAICPRSGNHERQRDIRLLMSDVDGTLVTHDKVLTEAAKAAVRELRQAGIASPSPAAARRGGLRMLIEPLALDGTIAGFNGGLYVNPDLSVIRRHMLDPSTARQAVTLMMERGLDVWVYTEDQWLIRDPTHRMWRARPGS